MLSGWGKEGDVSTFLSWSAANSNALGSASPMAAKRNRSVVTMFDMARPVQHGTDSHKTVHTPRAAPFSSAEMHVVQELVGYATAKWHVDLRRNTPMRMQKAVRAPESSAAATVDTSGNPVLVLDRPRAKPATPKLAADRMPASASPAQQTWVQ